MSGTSKHINSQHSNTPSADKTEDESVVALPSEVFSSPRVHAAVGQHESVDVSFTIHGEHSPRDSRAPRAAKATKSGHCNYTLAKSTQASYSSSVGFAVNITTTSASTKGTRSEEKRENVGHHELNSHPKSESRQDLFHAIQSPGSNHLLSQPLFASPDSSTLSNVDAQLSSQGNQYLNPEDFFEQHYAPQCTVSPPKTPFYSSPASGGLPPFTFLHADELVAQPRNKSMDPPVLVPGASNLVSLSFDAAALDAFTFDISDSPQASEEPPLEEEEEENAPSSSGGNITPLKRPKCQDKLEAMQSMAKRRATSWNTKLPPKKDKKKMKEFTETIEKNATEAIEKSAEAKAERAGSAAIASQRAAQALGWCKCKHSRCLKVRDSNNKGDTLSSISVKNRRKLT